MYLVCIPRTAQARDLGAAAAVPLSIAASELSLGKQLSEGAESVVYEGVFRGQPVAVKKLRLSTSADLDRFRSELKLLAQLNHPNVVTLVGAHHGHCNMADKLDDWSRFSSEIWGLLLQVPRLFLQTTWWCCSCSRATCSTCCMSRRGALAGTSYSGALPPEHCCSTSVKSAHVNVVAERATWCCGAAAQRS